jgi:thiol:disulfide interchange protein DsbC
MRKFLLLSLALIACLMLSGFGGAYAYDKSGLACGKCHTLTAEQAKETLKPLIPDIEVLEVKPGPVLGLWEVALLSEGKKGLLYVDYSLQKIINGAVFGIKDRKNYTQESFSRLNRVDLSTVPLENSLVMGDKDAKNKIIVFDDPG